MNSQDDVCWFHEKLTRSEAESLLNDETNENGSFLVRESGSSVGDFVLSLLNDHEVFHYQIRKHGEDAFFSLDDGFIFHGLDTLIEYYQQDQHGIAIKLGKALTNLPPPPDTRRHGRTNLLHRATEQANYTIVSGLLTSEYRNLDAKNQHGQTAVHLAAKEGYNEILTKLIESKASVNCRDSDGYTPLHFACQNNLPTTVRILVLGGANVQERHTVTNMVPLHEAALRGHKDVIKVLLSLNAPVNPRTVDDEVPADLARRKGHHECVKILTEYKVPAPKEKRTDWYHGTLDRSEAVALLQKNGEVDGSFLVRISNRKIVSYVLTVMYFKQDFHFQIQTKNNFYFIDNGPYLESLEHVVEHYRHMSDGLPGLLIHPIRPVPLPPVPAMPPSIFNGNTLSKKKGLIQANKMKKESSVQSDLENISFQMDIKPINTLERRRISTDKNSNASSSVGSDFIPGENLILADVLGKGEFGAVHEGVYITQSGKKQSVAIKTLRESHSNVKEEFLREARLMTNLNHHCIVKLIGFSEGPPLLMVQELVRLGSMLAYLLEFPDRVNPNNELKLWASQIACGMKYLEELRLVHRDLAARNILLASRNQAKISDFGLSRTFGSNDYYRATQGGKWPIKWYAPESYNFGTFSHASDVWSFGITLWEMFSYGDQPYGDRKGIEVIQLVDQGERLSKPEKCPDHVYEMMEKCWSYSPDDRPTFQQLFDFFSNDPDYANLHDLIASADIS